RFAYDDLVIGGGETITASFTVTNDGARAGADVPQVYLTEVAGEPRLRLLGFERVELAPGESRRVTVTADPRLLATFDADAGQWRIEDGGHRIALARSATAFEATVDVPLVGRLFGR
ncbi:MAG TPA: fibronectin type III-like domain-contianing protein, partial [Candidatus Dormibacteraeota bacterium]